MLYSRGSICPFIRHIQYKTSKYFDLKFFRILTLNPNEISIKAETDNNDNNDIKQSFELYDKFVNKEQRLLDYESVYKRNSTHHSSNT